MRLYLIAGIQHATGPPIRQQLSNPNETVTTLRALTVALENWVLLGVPTPPSRVPMIRNGTLVKPARLAWPELPRAPYNGAFNDLPLVDFGSMFDAEDVSGVLTERRMHPWKRYGVRVPQVDRDGNEIAGIRNTTMRAPLGTYTGWNPRRAGFGEGDLCDLDGSFIPFAETAAERTASGDPRLSLEERYGDHGGYVAAVRRAAERLVEQRFLLEEDALTLVAEAEASDVLR